MRFARRHDRVAFTGLTLLLLAISLLSLIPTASAQDTYIHPSKILLAKGVSTFNPDVWWIPNDYGEPIDVDVEYQSCDQLAAIELLEVWGNDTLMIKIVDGNVTVGSGTCSLQPEETLLFHILGQAYVDTNVTSLTLTLKVTLEKAEVPPPPPSKKEEPPPIIPVQVIFIVAVVGVAAVALALRQRTRG